MTNKLNSENLPLTIDDIINQIKGKSSNSDYIYRGERKHYCKISSTLYREYTNIDIGLFDLSIVQNEMINAAKKHIGEPSDDFLIDAAAPLLETNELEILTELQHYGGKTNLIDFTTDYLIAIFFACDGRPKENGRVILLQKTEAIDDMIVPPRNPRHRIIVQKSIFVSPRKGFIEVHKDKIINIPMELKQPMLEYLRKYHDISAETIYNDIHGFIKNQNIHRSAYIEFYQGLTHQKRGYKAITLADKQREYKEAIKHYDASIELNPEIAEIYYKRGECWLHFEEWENAKKDFATASNMGVNISNARLNDYESAADFEKKTDITLPSDITNILGNQSG